MELEPGAQHPSPLQAQIVPSANHRTQNPETAVRMVSGEEEREGRSVRDMELKDMQPAELGT